MIPKKFSVPSRTLSIWLDKDSEETSISGKGNWEHGMSALGDHYHLENSITQDTCLASLAVLPTGIDNGAIGLMSFTDPSISKPQADFCD